MRGTGTDARRLRAIFAGSAGSLIEWYDFYIYAFSALYFSSLFFPKSEPLVQVMATSGIFAVGFLMRPIGGWYFGRLADRHGRQGALVASVVMMGLGSLAIAILPTYRQIGIAAPALLLLGRMAQGFATGGQYGTVATYLSEIATKGRRGFWSSFQYVTLIGGQLLASLVVLALQAVLNDAALTAYGWRIAFVIGALGAATILLLRKDMVETAHGAEQRPEAGSLSELLRHHWRAFVTVAVLSAGGGVAFYTYTTYMQKYLVLTAGMSNAVATRVMTAALLVFMLIQPLMGALSDRIGRRTNIVIFGAAGTLLTVPILTALSGASSPFAAFGLVLVGLVINSFYTSVSGLFKAELFPIHLRALGVGLAYGVGNALFGGTAENVAFAFKSAGNESGFYWYVTIFCAIAFIAALTLKDTRKEDPLEDVNL